MKKERPPQERGKKRCAGDRALAGALAAGFRGGLSQKGSGILNESLQDHRKGGYVSGKDALEDARQMTAMLKEKALTNRESKRASALSAEC